VRVRIAYQMIGKRFENQLAARATPHDHGIGRDHLASAAEPEIGRRLWRGDRCRHSGDCATLHVPKCAQSVCFTGFDPKVRSKPVERRGRNLEHFGVLRLQRQAHARPQLPSDRGDEADRCQLTKQFVIIGRHEIEPVADSIGGTGAQVDRRKCGRQLINAGMIRNHSDHPGMIEVRRSSRN